MGLSNDQKAILRLLSQRGEQGYDDLSALMGIDAAEVHERALSAAAELEAEGIPAPQIPAPPAGAEPPAAPHAPRQPEKAAEPAPPVKVEEPAAPPAQAEEPAMPPAERKPVAPEPAPPAPATPSTSAPKARSHTQRPALSLPKSGGARAAIAAGAAVVVLVIVLLATGGGSDDDDGSPTAGGGTGTEETVNTSGNAKLTQAVLDPVDGSDATGVATFGRVKNSLALQVEAEGLAPTADGDSYTIWLYESADKMLPLASTAVGKDGKIGAQVEVPTEVLGYLANETFGQIDISLTTDATLKASLAKATKEKEAPIYTGTDVLRGEISGPIIGAASR